MSTIQILPKNELKHASINNSRSTSEITANTFRTLNISKRTIDNYNKNKDNYSNRLVTLSSEREDTSSTKFKYRKNPKGGPNGLREKILNAQKLTKQLKLNGGITTNNITKVNQNNSIEILKRGSEENNNVSFLNKNPNFISNSSYKHFHNFGNYKLKVVDPKSFEINSPQYSSFNSIYEKQQLDPLDKAINVKNYDSKLNLKIEKVDDSITKFPKIKDKFNTTNNSPNDSMFKHNREVIGTNKEKLKKILNSKLIQKKIIKGKLIKILNKNITIDYKTIEKYKKKKNFLQNRKKIQQIYRNENKVGILTQKSPEILAVKGSDFVSRYEDIYVTPDELVRKHFDEKEINIIRSDPKYFSLKKSDFQDVDILKNRTLLEILEDEDKIQNHNLIQRFKSNLFQNSAVGQSFRNLHEKSYSGAFVKNEMVHFYRSSPIEEDIEHKLIKSNPDLSPNQSLINEEIITSSNPKIKSSLDYENKMSIFSERKKKMSNLKLDKIRKDKQHSLYIKEIINSKKVREKDEIFLINQYSNKIKDNYKQFEN